MAAQDLTGDAEAVDGDTLIIDDTEIDLAGIDAPELGQECYRPDTYPCGEQAADALADIVSGESVACSRVESDEGEGYAARCTMNGTDIGAEMVRRGWALERGIDDYAELEEDARMAKLGLWAGTFEWPWDWRDR